MTYLWKKNLLLVLVTYFCEWLKSQIPMLLCRFENISISSSSFEFSFCQENLSWFYLRLAHPLSIKSLQNKFIFINHVILLIYFRDYEP